MKATAKASTAAVAMVSMVLTAGCGPSPTGSEAGRDLASLPESLETAYRTDAERLAVRWLHARSQGPLPQVEIPEAAIADFHGALLGVWMFDHPARDSVVALYDVHTFPEPELREILVTVGPTTPLASAWRSGEVFSGVPEADDLIRQHGLTLLRFHEAASGAPWGRLRAERSLDIEALALRFLPMPGVEDAEPHRIYGDGHDIRAREEETALILDYSVGFADCFAGCIGRHTWSFRISNGEVRFLGSSGAPLPSS